MYDCECGSKNALRESSETKKASMISARSVKPKECCGCHYFWRDEQVSKEGIVEATPAVGL